MPLLRLEEISLAYDHIPLLGHVNFEIDDGERVCLVGRNGAGKTTLLRVITGAVVPDEGDVWLKSTLRVAHLEQEVLPDTDQTIFEVVAGGLGQLGNLLTEYHQLTHRADALDRAGLRGLAHLQARIETLGGWNTNQRVATVLTRLSLSGDKRVSDCSGGIRRQVMLARALVCEPDLLLLDEPTNHLDINAILWLEGYLANFPGALIFITHDRSFLRRLATRIVELDRGKLRSFPGNYDTYLRKKDELLEIEVRAIAKFDKKLAEEEAWIRQGIKARRTRNEGRVRALQAMRAERLARRAQIGSVRLQTAVTDAQAQQSGKLVFELTAVTKS